MFADRVDAGQQLGERLRRLRDSRGWKDLVVLGLPRGGVVVAAEVARALDAPLDVILVRKLGVPRQPEVAMGALGEGGVRILNRGLLRRARVRETALAAVERRERAELERRAAKYRGDRPPVPLAGRTAVVVDDGLATGSTARAACHVARVRGAARVVLAAPVAPPGLPPRMRPDADEVVCLRTPEPFSAIGYWYADFTQTSDDDVTRCLRRDASWDAARG